MTQSTFSIERELPIMDILLALGSAVAIIRLVWETPTSFLLLVGAGRPADAFRSIDLRLFINLFRMAGRNV
jgi:hypothetical protein